MRAYSLRLGLLLIGIFFFFTQDEGMLNFKNLSNNQLKPD